MTIDKQKLQKLLWAEAASFRADCADWKRNTEALQEFLGEKTVEEVALELLAENNRLGLKADSLEFAKWSCQVNEQAIRAAGHETIEDLADERDQLKAENEALRKAIADIDGALEREYWSEYAGLEETRAILDATLSKEVQP